jgi:nitroimidazol reductase NimA-like FMN-containing flavoprotein (pyridoxamine 5'-phosphate oxidase superfamily)
MRRFRQQISREECIRILQEQPRGVLSMLGDDDYPYGIPLDHWYCEENGRLYFHCAKTGHKLDAVRKHDKVSYCVCDEGFRKEGEWALNIRSVIVFGKIEMVEDTETIYEIARKLSRRFTDDEEYIEREIQKSGPRTLMFRLRPEHIRGKLVNEA